MAKERGIWTPWAIPATVPGGQQKAGAGTLTFCLAELVSSEIGGFRKGLTGLLAMQGTLVRSMVRKGPMCRGTAKLVHDDDSLSSRVRELHLLSLCAETTEAYTL
ncbi:hypothetical protein JEQ12_016157 [Ovis aries]|uniref:Uncharacterized protein n=1 Tax=Ovis aries TaxID=9940 RepID=A0A836ABN5_SHEEP|nr:hypothetical protein JEQ12_016157 [Ovis aries]